MPTRLPERSLPNSSFSYARSPEHVSFAVALLPECVFPTHSLARSIQLVDRLSFTICLMLCAPSIHIQLSKLVDTPIEHLTIHLVSRSHRAHTRSTRCPNSYMVHPLHLHSAFTQTLALPFNNLRYLARCPVASSNDFLNNHFLGCANSLERPRIPFCTTICSPITVHPCSNLYLNICMTAHSAR